MKLARLVAVAVTSVVILGACGKQGGSSQLAGIYHLSDGDAATSLELHENGTYTLRRESCASIGSLECGQWKSEAAGAAHVVQPKGLYWPTPEKYPSALIEKIALSEHDGTLVVTGDSEWAGSFTQRWQRGRECMTCGSSRGPSPCREPMPACPRVVGSDYQL